jgi:hypothetical protein
MPRFVVETVPVDGVVRATATALLPARFPELQIDQVSAGPDTDRWRLRAPSEAHLHRWAAASQLEIRSLRRADAHAKDQENQ